MRASRWTAAVVCVCLLTGMLAAQPAAQAPPAAVAKPAVGSAPAVATRPAQPVMDLIPAGAMGFAIVNRIDSSASAAEKFLATAGISEMAGLPAEPGWLVQMLTGQAMLADGFNPAGGFAVVMLDPAQFDVDLPALMHLTEQEGQEPATRPEPKLPVILLVPGQSVKAVFANYDILPGDQFDTVALRMGPMLATQIGDYVALSPNAKALAAITLSSQRASSELSKAHLAEIAGSHLAFHVNMKVAGPLAVKVMEQLAKSLPATNPAGAGMSPADVASLYSTICGDLLLQMDSCTLSLRFSDTGLVISGRWALDPQSDWGQAVAACKPAGGKLLDRVPDLPYALACGTSWEGDPEKGKSLAKTMTDKVFKSAMCSGLSDQLKESFTKLTDDYYGEATGYQMVMGGAPADSGLFAAAVLMHFKDATRGKQYMSDFFDIYADLLKGSIYKQMPEAQGLQFVRTEAAEKVAGVSVDTIEITLPKLAEMSEADRAKMARVLGEDRLRFRLAAINDKDVLLTFGGSQAMVAESIKAAASGGTVLAGEDVAEALKHMPAKPLALLLLNGGNLVDLITKAKAALEPDKPPLPFKITTKVPVAFGAAITGSEIYGSLYVPTELIKEAI